MRLCISLILSAFLSQGHSDTHLTIYPDSIYSEIEETIIISINVSSVENLFAVAFDLVYNPYYLEFIDAEESDFLNENHSASTSFMYDKSTDGRVIIALSRLNSSIPGVSTESEETLVSFRFKTTLYGPSTLLLANDGLLKPDLSEITFEKNNGFVKVVDYPNINTIPDTSFKVGDSLIVDLNEFVSDMDTPRDSLIWQVLSAEHLETTIDSKNSLHLKDTGWAGQTDLVIQVSDLDCLSDIDTFRVDIIPPVSVQKFEQLKAPKEIEVEIFPNPFNAQTNIFVKSIEGTIRIQIYDVLGRVLYSKKINHTQENSYRFMWPESFDINSFSSGIYLLVIHTYNRNFYRKMIQIKLYDF